MISRKQKSYYNFSSALIFAFILLIAHLYFLASAPYDLYADEAQYWSWSKNLDWGYFSKPPMVAWVIAATTKACGDGSFCVKLGSPILHFFTSLLVFGIGHRLFNRRVGFWASVMYGTLPGVTISSYIISTDPPFLFFWALSMYCLIRGLKDWHIKWWVLLGIATGLGMLSKYTMILFFVSVGIYFLISRENRIYLLSFKFWLSVFIAGIIYWQNFLWNKGNGFVSYLHTKDNANISGIEFNFLKMLEFIGAQFGIFGPILFTALLVLMFVRIQKLCKKDAYKFLFCFVIPFLTLIISISLLSRAHGNWAAPVYIAASVLVASVLINNHLYLVKLSVFLHVLIAVGFYQFHNLPHYFSDKIDPFRRIKGQAEFARQMDKELGLYRNAMLLTTDRKTHATLLYYLRDKKGNPPKILKWNADNHIDDHYDLTTDINKYKSRNFLLVTKYENIKDIAKYFSSSQKSGFITIPVSDNYEIEYQLFYLQNFQGYGK